ncbi:MalY/PatB family protein [Bradymonas sediminis]|uniref:cysteine-S-conjugate beta-lyase n=1 Tax=Bradymonas sediminis TaxID=1548548 RepID=A0A2Z4FML1_9DELT|nr:PatB family C-S lyase [Bradymonas sediminis]AWV90070.1 aminotransferase [Bradymonas sediminis]TDP75963.1 cystathionine beta-lyase [Bradymonas sediminis]
MTIEFDFDAPGNRAGTGCEKYDGRLAKFGRADVIPLWVADMDFAAPPSAREALMARAKHPIYGYATAPESLIEAFCGWYQRRHHWGIDPAHLLWSPGTVPIIAAAILGLTEPGDKIIVPAPVYPPFFGSVEQNGRVLIVSPLRRVEEIYHLDFEQIEAAAAGGAKMLLLCSPHNPIGRVWRAEELDRLVEIALRYDMVLVSDEVHADLVYPGQRHIPLALGAPAELRLVTALSQAKTFNMPGMGMSAAVVSNAADREAMRAVFGRLHLHPFNPLTMAAFEAAYRHADAWLDALMGYLDGNRRWLFAALSDLDGLHPLMPEATFLMWLDCRAMGKDDAELERFFVEQAGLGLTAGHPFGVGGSRHMRLNFGTQRRVLEQAVLLVGEALMEEY